MARSVRIITLPGVFQPRSDARLLAAAMRRRGVASGARVLDVFTGSGALEERGLLAPGAREEELLVIAGRASR